jgi:uncharacterized membrane protein YqjE
MVSPVESPTPKPQGFLSSLHALAEGLLGTVEERIELVSVELQEEKYRLVQTFIWICAAVFTAVMAVAFVSITIVYLFWESARLAALGGLALFYTTAMVIIIVGFRRHIARQPKPFAATLQEIKIDRACIRPES